LVDFVAPIISLLVIGQISLTVPLLLTRGKRSPHNYPLALFLLANAILAISPLLDTLPPGWNTLYCAIAFPMLFIISPSLWLYVQGITANKPWSLSRKHIRNYILLLPAIIVSCMILCLPTSAFNELFIYDLEVTAPLAMTLAMLMAILILLWLIQCLYTIIRVFHHLASYRSKLNDLFSNHENKQLKWIDRLLFMGIVCWMLFLTTLFSSHLLDSLFFNIEIEAIMFFILIWSLTHFGLQQKQPLVNFHPDTELAERSAIEPLDLVKTKADPSNSNKYQRSALSHEDSARIAEKITSCMQHSQLYLDPDLSLQALATHLSISPHYISQTLNETLNINFFNFVNQWRIEAAKPLIAADKDTILNIALQVGFNTRSSFYKAFKNETGKNPSEFRKSNI